MACLAVCYYRCPFLTVYGFPRVPFNSPNWNNSEEGCSTSRSRERILHQTDGHLFPLIKEVGGCCLFSIVCQGQEIFLYVDVICQGQESTTIRQNHLSRSRKYCCLLAAFVIGQNQDLWLWSDQFVCLSACPPVSVYLSFNQTLKLSISWGGGGSERQTQTKRKPLTEYRMRICWCCETWVYHTRLCW